MLKMATLRILLEMRTVLTDGLLTVTKVLVQAQQLDCVWWRQEETAAHCTLELDWLGSDSPP